MLVTDFAYRDMEERSGSLWKRFGHVLGAFLRRSPPAPSLLGGSLRLLTSAPAASTPDGNLFMASGGDFRWRRHPQLLTGAKSSDLDPRDLVRCARAAAVRGLFLARSGRFGEARSAFGKAASESTIDLTAIPGFWDLSRGGMLAAIRAYEDAGRFREASALGAQIRLKYRPRSLSDLSVASAPRASASGS